VWARSVSSRAIEIDLGPRVRVFAAHVISRRLEFAGREADGDACRDAEGAHDCGEGSGELFAVAAAFGQERLDVGNGMARATLRSLDERAEEVLELHRLVVR